MNSQLWRLSLIVETFRAHEAKDGGEGDEEENNTFTKEAHFINAFSVPFQGPKRRKTKNESALWGSNPRPRLGNVYTLISCACRRDTRYHCAKSATMPEMGQECHYISFWALHPICNDIFRSSGKSRRWSIETQDTLTFM